MIWHEIPGPGGGQAGLTHCRLTQLLVPKHATRETLLKKKAAVNALNASGKTPLGLAMKCSKGAVVALLKKHGGALNVGSELDLLAPHPSLPLSAALCLTLFLSRSISLSLSLSLLFVSQSPSLFPSLFFYLSASLLLSSLSLTLSLSLSLSLSPPLFPLSIFLSPSLCLLPRFLCSLAFSLSLSEGSRCGRGPRIGAGALVAVVGQRGVGFSAPDPGVGSPTGYRSEGKCGG